jgi:DNA-binding response OmpR family regulator
MNLLFVDDHRESADAFADLARSIGHNSSVAYDGKNLRLKISAEAFDFVFLDIHLPDADGRQLCDEIRKSETCRGAQVIALTGVSNLDRQHDMSAFDGYFIKPMTVDAFERLLNNA